MKKRIPLILLGLIVVFILIQLVPYKERNPPVTFQVTWANAQTETYFQGACADCHSNETVWPWYAKVAPLSWWIAHHVNEGREHFNVSVADMGDSDEAYEAVHEGWMPLGSYVWMHPKAKLTAEQREEFSEGLKVTFEMPENVYSGESDDHAGHDHSGHDHAGHNH